MDQLLFSLPFERAAIDQAKREVWGWASTEALASDGMVMTYEAACDAFERWFPRGNVREMHDRIAAGRAISWEPDEVKRRIWVGTHVSIGAESTWQKILDGTLQAFSIKGRILHTEPRMIQRGNRSISVPHVTAMTITELSYVDAPSDPDANFVEILRADGVPDDDQGELFALGFTSKETSVKDNLILPTDENITMAAVERADGTTPGAELHEVLVDPEELARAENVTITEITEPVTEADTVVRVDSDESTQDTPAEVTTDEVVRAEEPAAKADDDGDDDEAKAKSEDDGKPPWLKREVDGELIELTTAELAGHALDLVTRLLTPEGPDLYGLTEARDALAGFIAAEVPEAITMARRAPELDAEVTRLSESLVEMTTRLQALETAGETVERGESPAFTVIREDLNSLRQEVERYANEPIPGGPLLRGMPLDKLFPGDAQGQVTGDTVERALETLREAAPAHLKPELDALSAKVALTEMYRRGPTPMIRS